MESIKLNNGTKMEYSNGKDVRGLSDFLLKFKGEKGIIPSEVDTRLIGVRNYRVNSQLINNNWYTSTLIGTKGDFVKIVLTYDSLGKLTKAGKLAFGWITSDENLYDNHGVNLDIENRWKQIKGPGVYSGRRDELFEKGADGTYIGLNFDMTKSQILECPFYLIKAGAKNFVESEFVRRSEFIEHTTNEIFKLGESEHSDKIMMGQCLPEITDRASLNFSFISSLEDKARSYIGKAPDIADGKFAFAYLKLAV